MKERGIVPTIDRAKMLPKDFPAKYLEPPVQVPYRTLTREDVVTLLKEVMPFCIAVSLIPLVYRYGILPQSLWVSEGNLKTLTWLAEALGMPVIPLRTEEDLKLIRKYNRTHRWPVLVPCPADSIRPLIERLKVDDRCHCIFHVPDDNKAFRLAHEFSNGFLVRLANISKHRKSWWHDRLPILRYIFFKRLRERVQNKGGFKSIKDFATTEKRHWFEMLTHFVKETTGQTSDGVAEHTMGQTAEIPVETLETRTVPPVDTD